MFNFVFYYTPEFKQIDTLNSVNKTFIFYFVKVNRIIVSSGVEKEKYLARTGTCVAEKKGDL